MNIRWQMLVGSCLSLLLLLAGRATAQQPAGQLIIASVDESTAPTILLRAYGMDGQGNPLVLSPQTVELRHGGSPASSVSTAGTFQAGTFTIFVIDAPPGVESQLEQVQQAIEAYASPANMVEGVDYLAIYLIGESEASQLLAPTNFHNAVRNFFADPLAVQTGPTALVDSLGDLLQQVGALKPKPDIYTSLVVFTDGTDVVSSAFEADEIGPLAAERGIPIHTIWLENENLQPFSQQAGQDYLAALAAESRAVAARIDQETEVQVLWDRIGAFREHTVLQYVPENLSGG
ncbi:MAG: hypothetical protein R3300_18675, partial [Candidatus Promineifilaceae bacterium]|nr:hypothetical protein [Candidatus Promineifilaceae bacterium]